LDTEFFASAASEQARAESCDQNGRKSIGNRPSPVVKSSTSRSSRSTKQPSRSFRPTQSTTGST